MRVMRLLIYECDSAERMALQLGQSQADGTIIRSGMKITAVTLGTVPTAMQLAVKATDTDCDEKRPEDFERESDEYYARGEMGG